MTSIHRYTKTDMLMLSLGILQIISCYYSICPGSITHRLASIMVIAGIYIIARKNFDTEKTKDVCFLIIGVCMIVAVSIALYSFRIFRQNVLDAGFCDSYYCRFLYKPLGYVNNAWAEISVVIFGFSLLVKRLSGILMYLSACSVLLTFSRGAYLSLAIIILLLVAAVPKYRIKILTISIAASITVGYCCTKEFLTTIHTNQNYSQQKSTEWRINSSISSFKTFKKRPLLGYGNGSYTLAMDDGKTNSFSSFAPNLPIQILIENGIVGVCIYMLLIILITRQIYENRHRMKYRVIGCILFALLVKEFTQSTLLTIPSLCCVIVIMIAYIQEDDKQHIILDKRYSATIYSLIILSSIIAVLISKNKNNNISISIRNGIKVANQEKRDINELSQTEKAISQVVLLSPYDNYIKYILAELYIKGGKYKKAQNTLKYLIQRNPENAVYAFTSGYLMYMLGQDKKAVEYLSYSIILYPRLLHTQEFETIIHKSPNILIRIKTKVYAHYKNKILNPIQSANWGCILKYFGEDFWAKYYLEAAITEIPNLAIPWLLLGDKKKYNILKNGAFTNGVQYCYTQYYETNTVMDLFENIYIPRLDTWYK